MLSEIYDKNKVVDIYKKFESDLPNIIQLPSYSQLSMTHHVLEQVFVPECRMIDLGGGLNARNGVIASMGGKVTVMDIFEYDLAWHTGKTVDQFTADCNEKMNYLKSLGIEFINTDICKIDLRDSYASGSIDAITSYHCLEHLHQSPKSVMESAIDVLKPGGKILLEVPNAVNLLKRIKVLFGKTNYGSYHEYYESNNFTGHIREYSVKDLEILADKLGLSPYEIYGKNWYGTLYDKFGHNVISRFIDKGLQCFPGFCGSLFLFYQKSK